jgi:PPOX class probable F420-dependent enzyme
MTVIPEDLVRLLIEPNHGALGTVRPDNTVQVSPMWFEYEGSTIRFTHTNKRAKYRSLQVNPSMSLMVMDPADPNTYVEVRGRLLEIVPDPTGEFYVRLGKRYGNPHQQPPADSNDRVILVMSIEKALRH